jgi:plastocyanin
MLALGPFGLGQSAAVTFPNAGTFGYHCIPHQSMGMVGTVQVDAAGADSQLVQIGLTGLSFSPATAHIKPNGYVRWVNVSSFTIHTVTSN